MIDLSRLQLEDENDFWQIIWDHFQLGNNVLIWCGYHKNNKPIIIDVDNDDFIMDGKHQYLYLFGFHEYVGGTLHPVDYELFKQNKIDKDIDIKYENGIEITIDDIPNVYRLLG